MEAAEIVKLVVDTTLKVAETDAFKSMMFGEYSDGTPRSLPDALKEEAYSPKQKAKQKKKKTKKKAKKKAAKLKL